MSFNWEHYLTLAHHLAGMPGVKFDDEAAKRSAISRAYYSVFCRSRNHLTQVDGLTLPGSQVHKYVKDTYQKSKDKIRKKIGTGLDRLRKDRRKADYDEIVKGLDPLTAKSLITAAEVSELLSKL